MTVFGWVKNQELRLNQLWPYGEFFARVSRDWLRWFPLLGLVATDALHSGALAGFAVHIALSLRHLSCEEFNALFIK